MLESEAGESSNVQFNELLENTQNQIMFDSLNVRLNVFNEVESRQETVSVEVIAKHESNKIICGNKKDELLH